MQLYPRRFYHRVTVNAPIEATWSVFAEHERMGEFTNTDCYITEPGKPDRNGLGCVRVVPVPENGMPDVVEVVNYWEPHKLFGYHVISGAPISHHQGIVMFFEHGPRQSEFVYNMRLQALPETLEAVPDFYDQLDVGFRQYMACAEAECERRGAEGVWDMPADPIKLSELGGMLA